MKKKTRKAERITKQAQLKVRTGIKSGEDWWESAEACRQYCENQGYPPEKSEYDCRCDCYL